MGLSIDELELQSAEYLPAREVMTGLGGQGRSGVLGDLVASDLNVQNNDVVKDLCSLTGVAGTCDKVVGVGNLLGGL